MVRDHSEIHWLAGLLEGEGNFNLNTSHPRGKRGTLRIRLSMTDRDVVNRAAKVMGGGGQVMKIVDPRPNRKPIYRFCVYSISAEVLMRRLLPHMGSRRKAEIEEILTSRDGVETLAS